MKPLMIEASRLSEQAGYEDDGMAVIGGVAVIPILGFLTQRPGAWGPFEGTSYEEIEAALAAALEDPAVQRIVLEVDSPGGEVNGLFDLCDRIYEARQVKPIEAIAHDDAFSAAYALASSAEKVWCTRTSGLGSIGVIATHCDRSPFDLKQGLNITSLFVGKHKNDGSPHEPLSAQAREQTLAELSRLYDLFVDTVARNRHLTTEAVRSTEAGLFFGPNAIHQGLADGLMTFSELLSRPFDSDSSNPLLPPPTRRLMMTEPIETTPTPEQGVEEQVPEAQQVPEGQQPEAPAEAVETPLQARLQGLMKLCRVAKRPELLASWLEDNLSVEEAQESLLQDMEAQPAIATAHAAAKAPENPLIKAVQRRFG